MPLNASSAPDLDISTNVPAHSPQSPNTTLPSAIPEHMQHRANFLGLGPDRVAEIAGRYARAGEVVNLIDPRESTPIIRYLGNLYHRIAVDSTIDRAIFTRDLHGPLQELIDQIFTRQSIQDGIPYVAVYYGELGMEKRYKLILSLLHTWKTLGPEHERFGEVPVLEGESISYALGGIFQAYTAQTKTQARAEVTKDNGEDRIPEEGGRYCFWIPFKKSDDILARWIIPEVEQETFPDTFSMLPFYGKKHHDIKKMVAHLEEVYVLGLWKLFVPIPQAVLYAFFKKHRDAFEILEESDWNMLDPTGVTQGDFQEYTKKNPANPSPLAVEKPGNGVSVRRKRANDAPTRPIHTVPYHHHQPDVPLVTHDKPSINQRFLAGNIWNNDGCSLEASVLCTNFPSDALLCMGEYEIIGNSGQKALTWHEARYNPVDQITFPPSSRKKREFIFCFVPLEGNTQPSRNLSHTELTLDRPKEKSTAKGTGVQVARKIHQTITSFTLPPVASRNIPPQSLPLLNRAQTDPTEELALQVLSTLESANERISRTSQTTLSLMIGEITFIYDIPTQHISIGNMPENIGIAELMEIIGVDMHAKFPNFLQEEHTEMINEILRIEEQQSRDILPCFPNFGSRDEIEILAECRQNGHFTGLALVGSRYTEHLQGLQSRFNTVGLAISITRRDKEMHLSLLLRNTGKRFQITSIPKSPYFSIQDEGSLSSMERQMVVNVFLLLGILGKVVINPEGITGGEKSKDKKTQPKEGALTSEMILAIIGGTYKRQIKSLNSFSREQQGYILSAIKRLEEGYGRQLVSGGFDSDQGFYSCEVEGHQAWDNLSDDDLVVLMDEKISSVSGGRRGQSYIHDMIDGNNRLKEYLAEKMVATAKGSNFRGKRPFSNGVKGCFNSLWKDISEEDKKIFLTQVAGDGGKARNALTFITESGVHILQSFIDKLRNENIPLIYSRPFVLSVRELREYKAQLEKKGIPIHPAVEIED